MADLDDDKADQQVGPDRPTRDGGGPDDGAAGGAGSGGPEDDRLPRWNPENSADQNN